MYSEIDTSLGELNVELHKLNGIVMSIDLRLDRIEEIDFDRIEEIDTDSLTYGQEREVESLIEEAISEINNSSEFSSDQIDTIEDIVFDKLEQFRNEHEEIKDIVSVLKKQLQDVRDTVELRDAFTSYSEEEEEEREDASSEEIVILDSLVEHLKESIDEIDTRLTNLTRIIARGLMQTAKAVESTDQI